LQRIGRLHRHSREDRGQFGKACADILIPRERDLSRLMGRVRERHGLGPTENDGGGVYPDLLVIEAALRLIEKDGFIAIPHDNRRLVEGALHPEILDRLADELGPEWINHAAQQSGGLMADRALARHWRLTMTTRFERLLFPTEEAVRTRLGANDRLIDL